MYRIFTKGTLRKFWDKYPDSEQYIKTWYHYTRHADWEMPTDIKETFASSSILKNGRVVFNIKGNAYRIVTKMNYQRKWVFIRFIGTHEDYSLIDANTI